MYVNLYKSKKKISKIYPSCDGPADPKCGTDDPAERSCGTVAVPQLQIAETVPRSQNA